jgi:hypothetical protein
MWRLNISENLTADWGSIKKGQGPWQPISTLLKQMKEMRPLIELLLVCYMQFEAQENIT